MRPTSMTLSVMLLLASVAGLSAACDRAPPADGLKEWTAADHDGEKRSAPPPNQGPRQAGDAGDSTMLLVDATWKAQCASCHGLTGHGDGPQGQMFRAANLAAEDWQSKATDQEIAGVILNGKGRMPKFELPDEIVKGLVARVRSFRGR